MRLGSVSANTDHLRRLAQLEAIADSLSCLLMGADAEAAPRLLVRLDAIDLEVDLLREALGEA
jgi:hypothetical protein